MISFTSVVKNEVSKLSTSKIENISELAAIVINSDIQKEKIKIGTENASVARRIYTLLKELLFINPLISVRKPKVLNKKLFYIIEIKSNVDKLLSTLSILIKDNEIFSKNDVIDSEEELRAYLRGLFLYVGSINDPKTSRYHLEFVVNDEQYAMFVCENLNKYYLNSKYLKRENKYMVYIKEAEKISDFLRVIQAHNAVLYFEDIRIYRDHKNMTNRLNNCEQANVDKIMKTAQEQVQDIEKLQNQNRFLSLKPKEQELGLYRLKYKEASLQELSEIITYETGVKITKSGLNHRFKKIKEQADKF